MSQPTLKQRKTFALIRIIGGLVAALYLSAVVVLNMAEGKPLAGSLLYTALVALLGYAYAAWHLRALAAVAKEEKSAASAANDANSR
ncbi:MAG: hypothetical protein RBR77_08930 [Thauera sp.]|jgi:hypothetical protein|nr:hypothetical protein [Thauera sp.]